MQPRPGYCWVHPCDTLYVEVYPADTLFSGEVRVALYVTHRRVCSHYVIDSLQAISIPLRYTHTYPAKYCSLTYHRNLLMLYPAPDSLLQRSIFRHLLGPDGDTLIHNWWMDQSQKLSGVEWDYKRLEFADSSRFLLFGFASNAPDQCFWEQSKALFATLTFSIEDTMTICLDTCFFPPGSPFGFLPKNSTESFTPITNTPLCFSLSYPAVGDVTADGIIDLGDVVFLINYLYRQGASPPHPRVADVNGDGVVDLGDVVYLINYLFKGGLAPE